MDDDALTFDTTASTVFEVNPETRTIRGLVVPFGVLGENGRGKFMFTEDTRFSWPTDLTRLKLNLGHDLSSPVGYATEMSRTPQGIVGAFKIARGARGDQALSEAEDHAVDGLSMGLTDAAQFSSKDGVQYGVEAPIREVSLTPIPAFDDSRVTSVAASAVPTRKESDMETDEETTVEAPQGYAAIQAELDELTARFEKFTTIPPREPNQTAQTDVTEEPPYRFDGYQGGKHSLLEDAKAAQFQASGEAAQRLETFMGEAFGAIATADVKELSPTTNKPEMYVGPLRFNRPLWNMVSKGSIPDSTPFTIPKFATKTGKAIKEHTQGQEPDEFSITTQSQTVTPTALSGLAIINREVYDQGGNPSLDRIIWDEVTADYFENLENAIAAQLKTGTGSAIKLGAGETDAAKLVLLKKALLALQFTKGGDRYSQFAGDPTLYELLGAATDDLGRALLPVVNATNADGTTMAGYEGIKLGNKTIIPAWALTAAAMKSYMFVPESVWAWVSAPRRLDLQVAVKDVRIGVWGYKASAVTRLTDIIPVDAVAA